MVGLKTENSVQGEVGKENWQAYSKNTLLGEKGGTYLGKKEWHKYENGY